MTLQRKAAARKPPRPRECPVCGTEFVPRAIGQKGCSPACVRELMPPKIPAVRKPKAAKRKRPTPQPPVWKEAKGSRCERCGRSGPTHLHHIVTRQYVRRYAGDQWDPANGMTLCPPCHSDHHSGARRLPLALVSAAALRFADELMGPDRAALYFARFYVRDEPSTNDRSI